MSSYVQLILIILLAFKIVTDFRHKFKCPYYKDELYFHLQMGYTFYIWYSISRRKFLGYPV
jgi:hypothetical protein